MPGGKPVKNFLFDISILNSTRSQLRLRNVSEYTIQFFFAWSCHCLFCILYNRTSYGNYRETITKSRVCVLETHLNHLIIWSLSLKFETPCEFSLSAHAFSLLTEWRTLARFLHTWMLRGESQLPKFDEFWISRNLKYFQILLPMKGLKN